MGLRNSEYWEPLALRQPGREGMLRSRQTNSLIPLGVRPNVFFPFSASWSNLGVSWPLLEAEMPPSRRTCPWRSRRPSDSKPKSTGVLIGCKEAVLSSACTAVEAWVILCCNLAFGGGARRNWQLGVGVVAQQNCEERGKKSSSAAYCGPEYSKHKCRHTIHSVARSCGE